MKRTKQKNNERFLTKNPTQKGIADNKSRNKKRAIQKLARKRNRK